MHRRILIISAFLILVSMFAGTCQVMAVSYSSRALIENAKMLDGKKVTYKGEAVTAIMNRGEYSWVNLNDGDYAIGIWADSSLLDKIKVVGDYKHKGDIVEVDGVFYRACPVHGGQLDIHASRVRIIDKGYFVRERLDVGKARLAIILFVVAFLATILLRKRI